jgi:hypothetical protein
MCAHHITVLLLLQIALGDFCMDPTSYARSIVSQGTVQETVQYYTSCAGQNSAGEDLYNAEYASNMMLFYINEIATVQCPNNPSLTTALDITEGIAADVQAINTIADCAPYKEYWETFFNEGMCSDIFDGIYLIWVTQTLAVVFLFGVAVIASLMYPYMKLSQKQIDSSHRLGISSHASTSTVSASSGGKNPIFEMTTLGTKKI